jgi:hypothetical protein
MFHSINFLQKNNGGVTSMLLLCYGNMKAMLREC